MRIGGDGAGQRQRIGAGGHDHAEGVGAGLEQQLRGGVSSTPTRIKPKLAAVIGGWIASKRPLSRRSAPRAVYPAGSA